MANKPTTKREIAPENVWCDIKIVDQTFFDRLCARYTFDPMQLKEKLEKLEYREEEKSTPKGETKPMLCVRTKGGGGRHEVLRGKDGIWYCTCPSYIFKGGIKDMRPCKHLVGLIVSRCGEPEDWMQYLV